MPGPLDETGAILRFIATRLSRATYVHIMPQYHPCGRADQFMELCRAITDEEYRQTLEMAKDVGLTRLDQPDFALLMRRLGMEVTFLLTKDQPFGIKETIVVF